MKHLLNHRLYVEKALSQKLVMLFLDFDGTLAPIADVPEKASLPLKTKNLLRRLSSVPGLKVAIISGRSLCDIKGMVQLKGIIYVGNHGLELEGPRIRHKVFVSARYLSALRRIRSELESKIAHVKGAFIEDKGFSLALHYRLVDRRKRAAVKALFHESIALPRLRGDFRISFGKMVLEVLPRLVWNKGKIVLWLLARQGFAAGAGRPFPVYVGDDTTDEDAFKALKGRGLTVLVGEPRASHASYYLSDIEEVAGFLQLILKIKSAAS